MGSSSRVARTVRGIAAAVIATLVAGVFHAAGGGAFPPAPILALALAFAVLLCIALAGRRVSSWRLVPAVVGSQALFHLVFSIGSPASSAGHTATPGDAVSHGHAGHALETTLPTSALADAGATTALSLDAVMTLAHLAAVVVTVLAVRFGEAAFWSLVDTARLVVAPLVRVASAAIALAVAPDIRPRGTRIDSRGFVPVARADDLSALGLRGPPSVAVF
ncbi:hypothetical protein [Marisediminicola sp. LYQ85]|uniref:hypothetical protein n=1 Tax=Marisediminicola sp. LYQ85 TaxID=3391062 RepID=UPI003982EED3